MVIFIDTEKSFDETQDGFLKKTFNKLVTEGNFYENLAVNIILNGGWWSVIPLKIKNKERMFVLKHCTVDSSLCIKAKRRKKRHQNWKWGRTVFICRRHDHLYLWFSTVVILPPGEHVAMSYSCQRVLMATRDAAKYPMMSIILKLRNPGLYKNSYGI